MLAEIIAAVLFVVSGGLLFNKRFQENWFLLGIAALVAIASTYYLTKQIAEDIADQRIEAKLNERSLAGDSVPQTIQPQAPDPRTIELEYWRSIIGSNNAAAYQGYLKRYPNGAFAGAARSKINDIQAIARERERKEMQARTERTKPTDAASERVPVSSPSTPPEGEKKCVPFNGQLICN